MTKTEELLLRLYNKPRLSFAETCKMLNMSVETGYMWRSKRKFPIAFSGSPMSASIFTVAAYIDELEKEATFY